MSNDQRQIVQALLLAEYYAQEEVEDCTHSLKRVQEKAKDLREAIKRAKAEVRARKAQIRKCDRALVEEEYLRMESLGF